MKQATLRLGSSFGENRAVCLEYQPKPPHSLSQGRQPSKTGLAKPGRQKMVMTENTPMLLASRSNGGAETEVWKTLGMFSSDCSKAAILESEPSVRLGNTHNGWPPNATATAIEIFR